MAFYMNEEQVWKCHKHPSKRRITGICAKCLRDRLATLCPDCANTRPCNCAPPPVNSSPSPSSSSASFLLFSLPRGGCRHDISQNIIGTTVSKNLEGDPALRKSRSVAISLLRSRSRSQYAGDVEIVKKDKSLPPKVSRSKINFRSMFTVNKSKKCDVEEFDNDKSDDVSATDDDYSVMMRSRSVAVGAGNRLTPASSKEIKGWYFTSPISVFRHSKSHRSVPVALASGLLS